MKSVSVFDYLNYLDFIKEYTASLPNGGRGFRKTLSEGLNCQMSFISHVLNGDKDFSSEQILRFSILIDLNPHEQDFLMGLHAFNRSGTVELKNYYLSKLESIKSSHIRVNDHVVDNGPLSIFDQALYYSDWSYSAVHIACTVEALQSLKKIQLYYKLDDTSFSKAVEFLSTRGLIICNGDVVTPGSTTFYIEKQSTLMDLFHCSWRLKLLKELRNKKMDDIHYTVCFSISQHDFQELKNEIKKTIRSCLDRMEVSTEEKIGLLCIDLQEL